MFKIFFVALALLYLAAPLVRRSKIDLSMVCPHAHQALKKAL